MAEVDYFSYEMALFRAVLDISQQRTVYLDKIRHIAQKISCIGISRTVIVNSHFYAHITVSLLEGLKALVVYLRLLGHLNYSHI